MNVSKTNNFNSKKFIENFFSRFYMNSKLVLILISFLLAVFFSLFLWMKEDSYQLLYDKLSQKDQEEIVLQLTKMHIPYRISKNDDGILVQKKQLYEVRLLLSENGFSKSISDSEFDLSNEKKIGMINFFSEEKNNQVILEKELAKSILLIHGIKDVKVHLSLPKESIFLDKEKKTSASVILTLFSGQTLGSHQVDSIVRFISNSVTGLSKKDVIILDQFGRFLNRKNNNLGLHYKQFNYINFVEENYKSKIESMLFPILGKNNVCVQVMANIDLDPKKVTEKKYYPNFYNRDKSIRSEEGNVKYKNNSEMINSFKKEQHFNKKNKISSETEPKEFKNYVSKKNSNINYELSHITKDTKINSGRINKISVSVVVNHILKTTEGKKIFVNDSYLDKIKSIVSGTIGFSKERGDCVNVTKSFFYNENERENKKKINIVKNSFLKDNSKENILISNTYLYFITFLIFLILLNQLKFLKYKKKLNHSRYQNTNRKERKISLSSINNSESVSVDDNNKLEKDNSIENKKLEKDNKKNKENNELEKDNNKLGKENSKNNKTIDKDIKSEKNKKSNDSLNKIIEKKSKITASIIKKWMNGDKL
ncbi:Flagellar M-ring protein [Buchnera aphidicola (Tetraneura ulmi)]|uniref:flagellar basal-body MS-ring/collar protein FliF n=1 Tax=Buchnera aphidicola TaxID=9 RepID=UPI0034648769